jgi:hypothetical protein
MLPSVSFAASRRTLPRADSMKKLLHLSKENQHFFATYCGVILVSFFGNQTAYDDTDILAGSVIFVQLNLLYLYFIWKQQHKEQVIGEWIGSGMLCFAHTSSCVHNWKR